MQSLEVLTAVKDFLACAQGVFAALQTPPRVPSQQLSSSSQEFLAWKTKFLFFFFGNALWGMITETFWCSWGLHGAGIYSHSHPGALQLPCSWCFPGICVQCLASCSSTKKGENLHMHGTKCSSPPSWQTPLWSFIQ